MPGDPHYCRLQADCCLEIAKTAPSLIAKLRFEGLAHSWLRRANEIEHAKALLVHWQDADLSKTG